MTEPIAVSHVDPAAEPYIRTARRRFGFILALAALILMMIGASAPSPFYPVLAEQIGFAPIVISAVFAVYAVALLVTLLTAGSLSDHVGRRPVIIIALVLLSGSMLLFSHADTATLLVMARVVQGIASGFLLATLSAAVLDLAHPAHATTAALWNALSPSIGLALGALLSGLALDVLGEPLLNVFGPLTTAYLLVAALFLFAPETAPKKPGAWASLRFRLAVPYAIRADFWRGAPAIVAGWATGGLFLSLGANIVRNEVDGVAHIWQALGVAILTAVGALTAFALRRRTPRTITIFGTAALATGTALSLGALALGSLPAYFTATGVTGMGFGTAFSGVIASFAPRIPSTERADTFAAIFLLAYLAFGIPSVIAGMLVDVVGLDMVCVGYGLFVIVLSMLALAFRVRRAT